MRTMTARLCAWLLVLAGVCLTVLGPSPAAAQGAFYRATDSEIAGPVGSLIRKEPRVGAAAGATAYKVLYRSTKPDGTPIAVSEVVIIPPGTPPPGGWPIVAWAHPTTGVVPHCAPSLALFVFQQMAGSRRLLENGYAIAATDYPGLGTPGPHPYLVGDSEARAVIDSVRTARSFPGLENSARYAVWGHSQGGQAALFTGMIAKTYAPELQLVGVAAAAPATDLAALMTADLNTAGGRNLTAMTIWSWARVFGASMRSVVEPAAMPVVDALVNQCIEGAFDLYIREKMSAPLAKIFLSVKNCDHRTVEFASCAKHRGRSAARHPRVFVAGISRRSGASTGHASLQGASLQSRQQSENAGDAGRKPRIYRLRQRECRSRLDGGTLQRRRAAQRLLIWRRE